MAWRARYPDPAGKGTDQIERVFRTRAEAEAWLAGQTHSVATGTHLDPAYIVRLPTPAALAAWVTVQARRRAHAEAIRGRFPSSDDPAYLRARPRGVLQPQDPAQARTRVRGAQRGAVARAVGVKPLPMHDIHHPNATLTPG